MKVLHLIESAGLYGAEQVILNLSREMENAGDYKPIIGCIVQSIGEKNQLFDRAEALNIKAVKFVIRNSLLFVDLPKFAKKCKKINIDLIHSHGYKPSVFGSLTRLLIGVNVTSTCHLWFMGGQRSLKQRIMMKLEFFFYRFFPVIIGVSESIRDYLISKGIDRKKVIVIKNGIFIDDYKQIDSCQKSNLRKELSIKDDTIVTINVARLTEQKAQNIIISAAKNLRDINYNVTHLIVGEGPLRKKLETQAMNQKINNAVLFLGFRDDIKALLHIADVFVLPSLDEGMPISLLEAVASGIPVITTPVGDIPKLIINNKGGLLVNIGNVASLEKAIIDIVENPEKRIEFAKTSLKRLESLFSSENMYEMYDLVYKKNFMNNFNKRKM